MRIVWHVKSLLFVLAAFVGAGAIVNAHFEKLPLAEAFYFAVITGLTVD